MISKTFKIDNNEVVDGVDDRANKTVLNLFKNDKSKKLTHMPNIVATREYNFLTPDTKKVFNYI